MKDYDVQHIPLEKIDRNPLNPRGRGEEGDIKNLLSSITESGLYYPILVNHRPETDRYRIIEGHRRFAVFSLKKPHNPDFAKIPALVIQVGEEYMPRIFREINDTAKKLTGKQWLDVYALGAKAGDLPSRLAPAITVAVEDAFGNLVASDKSNVTLTLSSGTFSSGSSTVTVQAVGGVATFSGLIIKTTGSYTLSASDGTLAAAASNSVAISPAAASPPPRRRVAPQATSAPVGAAPRPVEVVHRRAAVDGGVVGRPRNGRRRAGDTVRPQRVEEVDVVASQFDILEMHAFAQGIVSDTILIGLMIGQIGLLIAGRVHAWHRFRRERSRGFDSRSRSGCYWRQ